ncbi:hypothetical protein [Nannocystis exedens]|uniref:hypothetical protein n=1 Tax=Nannocystis exedens TaxID=54 RepID=UPI000BDC22C3|nr:hypothetical protein [Nannocystis exedens]PCC66459.1 hypothetical protein NAEX_09047 [Nannocystis exedens]
MPHEFPSGRGKSRCWGSRTSTRTWPTTTTTSSTRTWPTTTNEDLEELDEDLADDDELDVADDELDEDLADDDDELDEDLADDEELGDEVDVALSVVHCSCSDRRGTARWSKLLTKIRFLGDEGLPNPMAADAGESSPRNSDGDRFWLAGGA